MSEIPSTPHPVDPTWLNRVQALLAKAERTDFPQEAEALMAKAQDLMARHAISRAMLDATGSRSAEIVTSRRVVVAPPYAGAKRTLLGAVATANGCRVVYLTEGAQGRVCQLFGFPSDLTNVETLYSSLSIQAVRAMLAAPVPAHDTPRRFRHAFLLAYASRVGQRLREAADAARYRTEPDSAHQHTDVALVLSRRDRQVDEALRDAYPRTRRARSTASSGAGWSSGRSAAERAGLGNRKLGSSRPALGAG